ncbi:STAS domain-containing protein [Streptomyces sp. MMBL 11-3]|uniref:STAS domain-containing protein n=1 Tax=Streptomyces sp. MMBL 11-3 TaxID=3382639 RepID=UPI0039B48B4C
MSLLKSDSLPATHLPGGAHARCFRSGEATVVELHGEIDLFSAAAISAELDGATEPYAPQVLVDLRPVTFIDTSGLDVLHRAHARVRSRAGLLRLVVEKPHVRRLLRLAAPGLLPLTVTVDDLSAAGRRGRG